MALPLRHLSGIYLALATAAFAVALDRWIFILPDFDLGPVHVSLFELGSTDIDPLQLFGYTFDTPGSQLMLSAVAFALVAMVVAGVRWTAFGRQLVAMRDSEAACATLGLNLVWPRLAVFMLSAGIAGLGGALYGMQLGTVSPTGSTWWPASRSSCWWWSAAPAWWAAPSSPASASTACIPLTAVARCRSWPSSTPCRPGSPASAWAATPAASCRSCRRGCARCATTARCSAAMVAAMAGCTPCGWPT